VVLDVVAREHSFHPVVDYLNCLVWDNQPRIDRWLVTYGHAPDTEFVRKVGSLVLIAAVRRVRHPGCKFDEMLVLVSSVQGTNKSSAIETLCPRMDWFADDLPLNVSGKEVIERTGGRWIIEAGELAGLRRAHTEHLKALLSRRIDGPVRMAYARKPVYEPRQFVVIGTTNSESFLKDTTGNRRFWPVSVDRFDIAALARDRDQLWAEAAAREARGEDIRLPETLWDEAAEEQDRRLELHPWYDILATEFEGTTPMKVDPETIWQMVNVGCGVRTAQHGADIRALMERFGFKRQTIRVLREKNKPVKGWQRGEGEVTEWLPRRQAQLEQGGM
jgi:predicted P-loop ATPase